MCCYESEREANIKVFKKLEYRCTYLSQHIDIINIFYLLLKDNKTHTGKNNVDLCGNSTEKNDRNTDKRTCLKVMWEK